MNKFPHVTVVILNWNGLNYLKQNLQSVLDQEYQAFSVLAVDNGSDDGSKQFLQSKKKQTKNLEVLKLDKNLGFVGGNNEGLRRVLKKGRSEFAVLLNNDVRVEKDWLSNLLKGFSDKEIGICTSKIFLYHPYHQVVVIPKEDCVLESARIGRLKYHPLEFGQGFDKKGEYLRFPKDLKQGEIYNLALPFSREDSADLHLELTGKAKVFSGSIRKELKSAGQVKIDLDGKYIIQNAGTNFVKDRMTFEDRHIFEFDKDLNDRIVDAGCGASMAIRVELLEKLGLLKKAYFMYNEDSELSYRYGKSGFKTKFASSSLCYHYFWGSSGGEVTKRQTFYRTRNRLFFIREYFGLIKYAYYFMRTFARSVVWGMKSLTGDKKAKMYSENYFRALVSSFARYDKE